MFGDDAEAQMYLVLKRLDAAIRDHDKVYATVSAYIEIDRIDAECPPGPWDRYQQLWFAGASQRAGCPCSTECYRACICYGKALATEG